MTKRLRINDAIRSEQLRLIDNEDAQLGVVSRDEALKMAAERELDLVEVSPKAQPPVCKIMDYGKYLYRQNKVEQKHKKMQKKSEVKGIRISLRTGQHDLEIREKQARKFLEGRDSVKVQLIFKGREAAHHGLAEEKMTAFARHLADISKVDTAPKRQGMSMIMLLVPIQKGAEQAPEKGTDSPGEKAQTPASEDHSEISLHN